MTTRNTTTRDKHRAYIKRTRPDCGLCRKPIDYDLPYLDPMSYVVDHIIAIKNGGPDTLENKQAAHRSCNESKGAKTAEQMAARQAVRTFVTTRSW
jgi:5-methylcytosine-specific restriction endonuclease McrA